MYVTRRIELRLPLIRADSLEPSIPTDEKRDEKTNQGEVEFSLELITPRRRLNSQSGHYDSCQMMTRCKVGDTCCAEWELQLYNDSCAANRKDRKILLSLIACDKQRIRADFSLHVGDSWSEKYSADFLIGDCHGTTDYVADGEKIQCKGKYYFEETVDKTSSLVSDLELLFDERLHSDVTLTCGNGRLSAHKAILAARSPVFKAMFQHPYKEREMGNVDIEDVDYKVLKEMLHFMYTGKQPKKMSEMAEQLLSAADKYQLDELKTMCRQHLTANLTVDNVVRILVLADTHDLKNLKTTAQQFIRKHKADVVNTADWSQMFFSHPALAVEIVKYISV